MSQIIDETGNRYGHLTVIERAGSNSQGGATWLCRYDSGQDVVVLGTSLRTGKIQGLQYQNREHTGGVGVVDETSIDVEGPARPPRYKVTCDVCSDLQGSQCDQNSDF